MKIKQIPNNSIRIVEKFLFFPETHYGETRWLEWAIIVQSYDDGKGGYYSGNRGWSGLEFADSYISVDLV